MKKETFLAAFFGVFFGLVFSFLLLANISQNQLEQKTKQLLPQKKEVSIIPVKTTSLKTLTINTPKNFLAAEREEIIIEGEAEKDALIVIQSPIKDLVFQNKKEKFKVNFPLALGENIIKVVAYPKNRNLKTQEKTLYIYYLPKEI